MEKRPYIKPVIEEEKVDLVVHCTPINSQLPPPAQSYTYKTNSLMPNRRTVAQMTI